MATTNPNINFFSGSPLNRLSWLRPSHAFLNALVLSPATRWIVFNGGQPLVANNSGAKQQLAHLPTNDVLSILGPQPFFGQAEEEGNLVRVHTSDKVLGSARHRGARLVFLGIQEHLCDDLGSSSLCSSSLDVKNFEDAPEQAVATLKGTPFFCVDVGEVEQAAVEIMFRLAAEKGEVLAWMDARGVMACLDAFAAGVYAQARSMVDWNQRNRFCPACGAPTYSMWGGWKISCATLLPWFDRTGRLPCPTEQGLHNFTHPRIDPVVIMVAIDQSGDKILLGKNKKFPGRFFSALAGFMEPGESFEDAVRREMWEEAGVVVWNIQYHSGQPWPYPSNLMVGFYATADSSLPIRTDLDNELDEARWFTREEVLAMLNRPGGTTFTARERKHLADVEQSSSSSIPVGDVSKDEEAASVAGAAALAHSDPALQAVAGSDRGKMGGDKDGGILFKLPPVTAIAGVLIRDWAEGKVSVGEVAMKL